MSIVSLRVRSKRNSKLRPNLAPGFELYRFHTNRPGGSLNAVATSSLHGRYQLTASAAKTAAELMR